MLSSRQERAQRPSQEAKGTSIKDQLYVAATTAVLVTAGGTRVHAARASPRSRHCWRHEPGGKHQGLR